MRLAAARLRVMKAGRSNRGFVGSVAVLVSGTAAGQAITVAGSPFVLRLYTPDQVGVFGVYLALVSIGAIAVTLRYEGAIPLPSTEEEALDVLALTVLATICISGLVGFTAWLVAADLIVVTVPPAIRAMLWLVPLGLLFAGLQQTLTFWAIRLAAFGASARSSLAAGGTQTGSQIALGVSGAGGMGLAIGYLLGRVGGILPLVETISPSHRAQLRRTSAGHLRAAAARYRRFPLYSLWAALLNAASAQSPVLLLAVMFDTTVVGWFSITVRVLQLPSTIVGGAVAQVFYSRVSHENPADVATTTTAVYRSLVALGTGPMVLLAVGGQQLFALFFGEAWREAGTYAQWLAPWLLVVFITSPLSTLVWVRERQRAEFVFQVVVLSVRLAALVAGWALGSPTLAVALYGVGSAVLWGGYMLWLLRIGGASVGLSLRWLMRELTVAVLLSTPLLLLTLAGVQGVAWLGVAAASLGIVLFRSQREIRTLTHTV